MSYLFCSIRWRPTTFPLSTSVTGIWLVSFSHRMGQTTQGNLLVNLKLLKLHWFCYLCILSKIVAQFLFYGPQLDVLDVAGGVLDKYWQISSWNWRKAYEVWHCSSVVSNTWCSQHSQQNNGGNIHDVLQVYRYWNTIFANFVLRLKLTC